MMTRIRPTLFAAALCLAAVPAAAQILPGVDDIPLGSYEYRWQTVVGPDTVIRRTPARGYLRLHENGRYAHSLEQEGTLFSHQTGGFAADGNHLYISKVDPGETFMTRDTLIVRHAGDRLFLWKNLHDEGWMEYELAREGAPAERPVVPGVVPGPYAYLAELRYFEAGNVAPPRPERRFATRFASDSTRYLWVQLKLEYPILLEPHAFQLDCRFRDDAGQEVYRWEYTADAPASHVQRYVWFGWGADAPGTVPPGTYRVGCTVDGVEMLLEGSFQVT